MALAEVAHAILHQMGHGLGLGKIFGATASGGDRSKSGIHLVNGEVHILFFDVSIS